MDVGVAGFKLAVMKVVSWILLAGGCYGALACLLASGLLGAIWAPGGMLTPWDWQARWDWIAGVARAAAAGWPWVAGMFLCFCFALVGTHLQMREPRG